MGLAQLTRQIPHLWTLWSSLWRAALRAYFEHKGSYLQLVKQSPFSGHCQVVLCPAQTLADLLVRGNLLFYREIAY